MPHHELLLVQWANAIFGPMVASALAALGYHLTDPHAPIPDYLVMCVVVVLALTGLGAAIRSRLSVEHPGKFQIALEDLVSTVLDMMRSNIGPKGPQFFPLVGSIGLFVFTANMIGKIPGLMSPTANINVTLGCAITVWVYYHFHGIKAQGLGTYLAHFAAPPGVPLFIAPIMLPIELISHSSRVMSLSLRLFGNIFGEEMVVAILASLIPFIAPLPMMVLGVVTGTLQAFIFMLLTMIYLAGAVQTEHDHEVEHGSHDAEHGHAHAPATA